MSAVRSRDIGPVQTLTTMVSLGERSWQVDVTYRVTYASVRARGLGLDPDVTIMEVTYEDGVIRKPFPMLPGLYNELTRIIEVDELGD